MVRCSCLTADASFLRRILWPPQGLQASSFLTQTFEWLFLPTAQDFLSLAMTSLVPWVILLVPVVLCTTSHLRNVIMYTLQYVVLEMKVDVNTIQHCALPCLQVTSSAVMPLTTQVWSLRWPFFVHMALMYLKRLCGTSWGHLVSCGIWQIRHSSSTLTQLGKLSTSSSIFR